VTRLAIIGTGYVGLTTGACFAHLGHDVVCADIDADKVARLSRGEIPIVEHRLDELVAEGLRRGNLSFVVGAANAVVDCEIAFLCVPTPQGEDGSADLSYIEAAAAEIASVLPYESIVVNKSTVPVGSTKVVERVLRRPDVRVVSNPEFLREGSAVDDFLKPDRVVVGCEDRAAAIAVGALYDDVRAQVIVTDPASAETIKYAANAFLATKLSFINAIAAVCEGVGADVNDVVVGMGYDKRIGTEFLRPGPGWGGSCFDGTETLIVRDLYGTRMVRFDQLADLTLDGLEVLSWAPGQIIPEFQPAVAVTQRPYIGDMIHLRTKMGRRLSVTADHPMIVRDGDESIIKLAGDITIEDWLPISLGSPLGDLVGAEHASMIEAIHYAGLMWNKVIVRLSESQRSIARQADHVLPINRRTDSRRCGAMRLTEAALMRLPLQGATFGTTTNGTYVPASVELTDECWEMIGLFLAEGHITTDGSRRRIFWAFHPTDEKRLADFVAGFWRRLGTKVTVRRLSTTLQVSISSRILASWFEHILGTGTNCYNHRLPDAIWSASETAKQAILRGLWAGDGSWSLLNGGPSVALEYGTVSPDLADGMLRLLAEMGIIARQKVRRTTKSTVDTHWLVISGADQIEDALWLLEPHERETVRGHVANQAKRIAPTGYRRDRKGTAWVRVASIEREAEVDQTVYSVEVAHNHTVVTSGGLVAHNCFPKDSRALLKIAHEAGYRFDLLSGVITVNDEQFDRVTDKIRVAAGGSLAAATIAVWGLTFKARTDDLRDSPSVSIINRLLAAGAKVKAFDPTVAGPKPGVPADVEVCVDAYAACAGANVLAVLTEWDDFRWLEPGKAAAEMTGRAIVDGRNLLDRSDWTRAGFTHVGIGR
jgi:UDPglucose 6-dehydrogenase